MTPPDDRAARLAALRRERDELAASLPAHSVPAAMLIRLEDLEDEIAALQATLDSDPDAEIATSGQRPAASEDQRDKRQETRRHGGHGF